MQGDCPHMEAGLKSEPVRHGCTTWKVGMKSELISCGRLRDLGGNMWVQHLQDIQADYWHTPGWGGSPISSGGVSRAYLLREGAEDWADSQHYHGGSGCTTVLGAGGSAPVAFSAQRLRAIWADGLSSQG